MGFDHVRLAIDYEVLEDEYGRTREEGFAYVTRVVEWCKRQGLNIVLDLHKAYGYDFNNAGDKGKNILFTNKMVQKRFVNLWIKIAEHYANETHVAFELLNEVVEQENAEAWNLLIAETVDAIRRIARDTIIIYDLLAGGDTGAPRPGHVERQDHRRPLCLHRLRDQHLAQLLRHRRAETTVSHRQRRVAPQRGPHQGTAAPGTGDQAPRAAGATLLCGK